MIKTDPKPVHDGITQCHQCFPKCVLVSCWYEYQPTFMCAVPVNRTFRALTPVNSWNTTTKSLTLDRWQQQHSYFWLMTTKTSSTENMYFLCSNANWHFSQECAVQSRFKVKPIKIRAGLSGLWRRISVGTAVGHVAASGLYSYLCQGVYVIVIVCLSVSNFVPKLPNGFAWNF